MIKLYSPTGSNEIRGLDDFGSGSFGASRGGRPHMGVDFVCTPGQDIFAPISGVIVRESKPYADALFWSGCLIRNSHITIKMWYLNLNHDLIGLDVMQGEVIGTAQDISRKYNRKENGKFKQMTPHIHLQIDMVDPLLLLEDNNA